MRDALIGRVENPGATMSDGHSRILSIFAEVINIPHPDRRQAFLLETCGDDEILRGRVEALVRAHENAGRFLEPKSAGDEVSTFSNSDHDSLQNDANQSEQIGSVINGRYTLVRLIGEGGMGNVFLARQTEPIKREVALKVVKAGLDSQSILARFEAERQALAFMDHPNIARVFDAGTTESGRPFFVMEYVPGEPITQFCNQRKFAPLKRLELFLPICEALQHAHRKGIIHRDIKPSNVLVAEQGGRPIAKVIDFGLVKVDSSSLFDESINTGLGVIIGTPEYMSPEQAGDKRADVDIRADVYSLGVLLFELLIGVTPFGKRYDGSGNKGVLKMLRTVRETPTPIPSEHVGSKEVTDAMFAARGSDRKKLTEFLRGDLDAILLKALAKNREERYASADDLIRDLKRFLKDEPVEAVEASLSYLASKFVRRHRAAFIGVVLLALSALIALASSLVALNRAEIFVREEQSAEEQLRAERNEAIAAALKEQEANERLKNRLQLIKIINEALTGIIEDLDDRQGIDSQDPLETALGKRLQGAADRTALQNGVDPTAACDIGVKLGQALLNLGFPKDAAQTLLRARQAADLAANIPPDRRRELRLITASALSQTGELEEAISLYREAIVEAGADRLTGGQFDEAESKLAKALFDAGKPDEAARVLERKLRRLQSTIYYADEDAIRTMRDLGLALHHIGNSSRALILIEEANRLAARQFREDHLESIACRTLVAFVRRDMFCEENAAERLRGCRDLAEKRFGPDHSQTLIAELNWLAVLIDDGQVELVIAFLEKKLGNRVGSLSSSNQATLSRQQLLARAYLLSGKNQSAIELFEKNVNSLRRGSAHSPVIDEIVPSFENVSPRLQDWDETFFPMPRGEGSLRSDPARGTSVSVALFNLATAYRYSKNVVKSLELYEEALQISKSEMGPRHRFTLLMADAYAKACIEEGRSDRAIKLLEDSLKQWKAQLGGKHFFALRAMARLGVVYRDTGMHREAIELLSESYRNASKYACLDWVGPELYEACRLAGQREIAQDLFDQLLASARSKLGDSPMSFRIVLPLAVVRLRFGEFDAAEPLLRDCLRIAQQNRPEHWTTFQIMTMLGIAKSGLRELSGVDLTERGRSGLKSRHAQIPKKVSQLSPRAVFNWSGITPVFSPSLDRTPPRPGGNRIHATGDGHV